MILNKYRKAKILSRIGLLANTLLIGLLLLQIYSSIRFKDTAFIILVILFGIFTVFLNILSYGIHQEALEEIEEKIKASQDAGERKWN